VYEAQRTFLWPLFLCLNSVVYAVMVVMTAVVAVVKDYTQFNTFCYIVLGVVYLASSIAFAYYGSAIALQLKSQHSFFVTSGNVFCRVVAICVTCSVVCGARGVYDILVSAHTLDSPYPSHTLSNHTWDALFYAVVELLPSFVVVALTRQHASAYAVDTHVHESFAGASESSAMGDPSNYQYYVSESLNTSPVVSSQSSTLVRVHFVYMCVYVCRCACMCVRIVKDVLISGQGDRAICSERERPWSWNAC